MTIAAPQPKSLTLSSWLEGLAAMISESRFAFHSEMLSDGVWNQYSWLHSRMLGVLAHSVPAPWLPLMEVQYRRGFRPDMCISDAADEIIAVVEYESTNSSDERLMGKDIANYVASMEYYATAKKSGSEVPPDWWVIISTLPPQPVPNWRWWGWNDDANYPPKTKSQAKRDANPFAYYEKALHASFASAWKSVSKNAQGRRISELAWVNITPGAVELMSLCGAPPPQPVSFPLILKSKP